MPTPPTRLVERFYHEVWNQADEAVAREILSPGFRFRASLGPEKTGPEGFIDYMRLIHAALGGYSCTIEEIVAEDRRAARACASPAPIAAPSSAWPPPSAPSPGPAPPSSPRMESGSPACGCWAMSIRCASSWAPRSHPRPESAGFRVLFRLCSWHHVPEGRPSLAVQGPAGPWLGRSSLPPLPSRTHPPKIGAKRP